MRLIDADKLVARLNNLYEWCRDERRSGIEQAMCMVHEALTVDAEPVRHGKWEEHCQNDDLDSPVYVCSECKVNVSDFEKRWLNYCPNCGAKMDLKGE
jgi:DNA-directed RNA polymerase subunit RPC12/RpoP